MDVSSLPDREQPQSPTIVLWWLPVGAGAPTRVSEITSGWWERLVAWREGREPLQLLHTALEVCVNGDRYVIEMAPEWSEPRSLERGVVVRGPVGLRALGRFRLFRYEVRRWKDGELSDRAWAVSEPVVVSRDEGAARALLDRIANVPVLVWGRPVDGGDMWNSNSLVAWVLYDAGIEGKNLNPPAFGRAPGWAAGITVAERQRRDA